jgi:hypothetical protein
LKASYNSSLLNPSSTPARMVVLEPGGLVVGVEVHREHVRGVEELLEEREVWAAPAFADELVGVLQGEIVEGTASVGAVGHGAPRLAVVAYLPGFGDGAPGGILLAEAFGDQTPPEGVGTDVVGELYRVRLHRAASL